MELKFDSISELEQFLMFSAHIGRAFAQAPTPVPEDEQLSTKASRPDDPPVPDADHTPEQRAVALAAMQASATDEAAQEETPKRKRRTKAEMEAERFAAQVQASTPDTKDETSVNTTVIIDQSAGANPFAQASPATQAILEAPNQSAAVLAGMAAMQSNPPAEEPTAAPREIASIDHLRACQSFIQAHGMTKYNESFQGGLNANIAAYTPEQRAQHVAILETLAA